MRRCLGCTWDGCRASLAGSTQGPGLTARSADPSSSLFLISPPLASPCPPLRSQPSPQHSCCPCSQGPQARQHRVGSLQPHSGDQA